MCGRLACYLSPQELCKSCMYKTDVDSSPLQPIFNDDCFYKYVPLYNLCPSLSLPVLIDKIHFETDQENPISSDYLIVPMRWGILPRWGDGGESRVSHTHNARLETISESKMYGYEIKQNRRCVILCNGYYEWQTTRADKQPYYIYHDNLNDSTGWVEATNPVLKLAGIFSKILTPDDEVKYSCSVITKEADSNLSWLHHRMPIALYTYNDVEKWIKSSWDDSLKFLNTYGDVEGDNIEQSKYHVKYHAVNKAFVNQSNCDSDKCILPCAIKRKNTLDDWICKRKAV